MAIPGTSLMRQAEQTLPESVAVAAAMEVAVGNLDIFA